MAYEVIILYHLHMSWYFVGTFTKYLFIKNSKETDNPSAAPATVSATG